MAKVRLIFCLFLATVVSMNLSLYYYLVHSMVMSSASDRQLHRRIFESEKKYASFNSSGSTTDSLTGQNAILGPQHNLTVEPSVSGAATTTVGYILALKIYEQQTMGTGNLIQLQCFASKLNLSVVQPLMKGSLLSTPLDPSEHSSMLQLEDVYDMQEWREHTHREGYAPLVKWEEFMSRVPRDVVLVQMKYPSLKDVKALRRSGKSIPHPVSETKDYKKGCDYESVEEAFGMLQRTQKRIVHRVCYNFFSGDEIPLQVYQRDLIGGLDASSVTVLVDQWRGFGGSQRVLLEGGECIESRNYREHVSSSQRVVRDAQNYVDKYLTCAETSGYLAVIARYEWIALTKNTKMEPNDPYAQIHDCLRETMKWILLMRKMMEEGVKTFLSMDIGKYGSKSFVRHDYYGHQKDMEAFVSEVYGNQMNITGWERTFESVVETADSGYVAKVQQAIVAQAKCVLFVGGGAFQRHTLHLYQQLHQDPANRCIRIVEKCTSPSRSVITN